MIRALKARPSVRGGCLFALLAALAIVASLGIAASASASELVVNGGFESGTLAGWQASSKTGEGSWFIYSRKEQAEHGNVPAYPPASGEYAVQDSFDSPDSVVLPQEVALPAGTTDELSMSLFYQSSAPLSTPSPETLEVTEGGGQGNQQLRVDVLRAGAPIRSVAPSDILATVFATDASSPETLQPTVLHANLSAFAGQTVILRIANAVEERDMETGIDDVSIASSPVLAPPVVAPIATPAPQPQPAPSNLFTRGKLTLNKKSGRGTLVVDVPDAGTLIASDARRKIAIGSRRDTGKGEPIYVRTATVTSAGAQAVRVPIRPTAAALKVLGHTGKLPVRLTVTFLPDGGAAATQSFSTTLVKRLSRAPARR